MACERTEQFSTSTQLTTATSSSIELKGKLIKDEAMNPGALKISTYWKWIKSGSSWLIIFTLMTLIFATSVQQYQAIMITHWTADKYKWTAGMK